MSTEKSVSFAAIREAARGRYVFLAENLASGLLSTALKKIGHHVPNPFRQGSKDGFRLYRDFNDSGMMVLNEMSESISFPVFLVKSGIAADYRAAMVLIGRTLGIDSCLSDRDTIPHKPVPPKAKPLPEEDYGKNLKAINALLGKCLSIDDPKSRAALVYLAARGINLKYAPVDVKNALLVNPHCAYSDDGQNVSFHPAIILKVQNEQGQLCSLHRTYLSRDGKKAAVACPKKLLPMCRPCCDADHSRYVRLGNPSKDGIVGVAEGLETALSVTAATRIPVWCCVSAAFLERFVPPGEIKAVIIFADKDASRTGETAAKRLKENLKKRGIPAFICLPREPIPQGSKGVDFNDTLNERGSFGFPNPIRLIDYVRQVIKQEQTAPQTLNVPKALRK